jgi:hypothetical protein
MAITKEVLEYLYQIKMENRDSFSIVLKVLEAVGEDTSQVVASMKAQEYDLVQKSKLEIVEKMFKDIETLLIRNTLTTAKAAMIADFVNRLNAIK